MAMRPRKPGQTSLFLTSYQLPKALTTPFFDKLNELLDKLGFDSWLESLCRGFYAKGMGCPSLAAGIYLGLPLLGIHSERASPLGSPIRLACGASSAKSYTRARRTT